MLAACCEKARSNYIEYIDEIGWVVPAEQYEWVEGVLFCPFCGVKLEASDER